MMINPDPSPLSFSSEDAKKLGKKMLERLALSCAGANGAKLGEKIISRFFDEEEEDEEE